MTDETIDLPHLPVLLAGWAKTVKTPIVLIPTSVIFEKEWLHKS
jgi:hypothetical protein